MKTLNKFLPLIFSFCFLTQGLSQEIQTDSTANEKTYYLIKKSDGNEFYGYILSDDGREILVQTKNIGKIYINKSDLKEIINLNKSDIENYGEFRETGPFTTRYYFSNNALPVKKGEVVEKGFNTTIIFMPSMRFNKSYDKAFQIALAGVINIDDSGDATSFPAPMVSWLRKF